VTAERSEGTPQGLARPRRTEARRRRAWLATPQLSAAAKSQPAKLISQKSRLCFTLEPF
jgi:hypothetical protein